MTQGRSVRLYLVDGSATGLITAEIVNWTGHVLSGPRSRLDAALKRDETKRTGVYVIFGSNYVHELPPVYVGEGDDISQRLYNHGKDDTKDYWDRFVAVTSKDLNLTKAHVKYLEARLIQILQSLKKSDLQNKTAPSFDKLPEADISDMETFISELRLILPVIGVDFFRKPLVKATQSHKTDADEDPQFVLKHSRKGIDARAVEVDGEFVVLAGSKGSLQESVSFHERIKNLRESAFESKRTVKTDNHCFELLEDIAFTSPSAAAVFLFGTSRNGRTDWLLEDSKESYGAWKDAQLRRFEGT